MRTIHKTLRSLAFIALSFLLVQCTELNAGKVKQDFNSWFTDLITPRSSSLEMANDGYILKGNVKNKPNQVIDAQGFCSKHEQCKKSKNN